MNQHLITRRQFNALAPILGLSLSQLSRAETAPASPQELVWIDSARASREVDALVRWPQGKAQGVVLYSHGLGGHREGGDHWGQAWAKAGFVVVHLQHAGSDAASLKGGFPALRKAMAPEQLTARVQDVKFAISEMARLHASDAAWSQVPIERLAIAGHSFGARSTLALAGWQRSGFSANEPRAKAFIALSPAMGKEVNLEQARQELKACARPMLLVSGSLDGDVLNNGETAEGRRMVYEALPSGHKAMLWLDQADHMSFGGNNKQIPSSFIYRRSAQTLSLEQAHHERVASISSAWLRAQLLGISMPAPQGLAAQDQWLRG